MRASVVEMLQEDLDALQWIDDSDEDCIADFGVPLFDELETAQKVVLMAQVGKALFDPRVPWPMHTAVAEAAIYVVYENIVDEIGMEIARQVKRGSKWRKWRAWSWPPAGNGLRRGLRGDGGLGRRR